MKKSNMGVFAVIFFNLILIVMITSSLGISRVGSAMEKYGADWPVADVTIDDVSFKYDGFEEDDGDVTYIYKVERILHFTYEGKDYELNDTEKIQSGNPDYQYELRKGYKDKYTYKFNPENPRAYSKSYSSVGDDDGIVKVLNFILTGIPIIILVIVDLVLVIKMIRRKKKVFDME